MNQPRAAEPATVLQEVYTDLNRAKAIITRAIDQLPDGYIRLGLAEGEAADALAALRSAPSLSPTAVAKAQVEADAVTGLSDEDIAPALDQIATVAASASTSLVEGAGRSVLPADVLAFLNAALYVGRLREQFE
ncbi:hypothetical protein [Actinomadura gamaensis]|uniref:Uncharacterized protein n=1 Tax=Actinomadura gamaensis TaxID=1763541 RepID=A0ABV9TTM2_9ACTN